MNPELNKEFKRKTFHCLSLVYLGIYLRWGRWPSAAVLCAWIPIEGAVEFFRLRRPELNALLMKSFGGIHRESEIGRISGIFWTTLGCLGTIALFGERPPVVCAAIAYLAFGDGVAALAGRAWGTWKWPWFGGKKSVQGSTACFAACGVSGWAAGLPPSALFVGAAAATVLELLPLPIDDNFWIPLLSAAVVRFFV
ncbi:MAG: hypothetical protein AUJ52_13435 [Elusimicrobia bacterium CG1_02_63_36]|nr:MAG: hypothetical protein AUJ52_13435 [Elusimicrobia bacterium CG1_02_63_36]PIP83554.1 MAG: hypothetical protein COR54_08860 [Elusimicrobia bacterium CG22_combo_CG10-13_8_21_14_all_63_91]PJA13134.1 MAG: hypothetical protein COX66_15710 [Elusimicrobia bacterium CG_4_10_14_0_2_um_filter_63_34]PJB26059.1 MAG: hypothetical protein CO113_05465 [Elusimicrobia bacterium CG_4_9_14_3_um_filter_62_55]